MPSHKVQFGLTLPNRGIVTGATTVDEMLALAEKAEATGWDSVWVGDSIFAKPRLDALVLLGALAARTKRVKLGPGCFASTPLRDALLLAYQWISLDFLSNGRTIFVSCQGAPGSGNFTEEFAAFHIEPASRMRRQEEAIEILRLTSSREHVSYQGEYNQFNSITVLPRPVQQPIPIWVTANPDPHTPWLAERALRRVVKYGDGWMTTGNSPESLAKNLEAIRGYAREEGRELGPDFEVALYYNITVNEDYEAALQESKRFLDVYYTTDYTRQRLEEWVALGPPSRCIEKLQAFIEAGATTITLRLTSYHQDYQFARVTDEVLAAFH
ncbi:N5,N10-methylene tetrahydromethanopterin reductase [Dictyobacter alpinus]|uniref:N5,N10-methylene tetrahydromethanopterin reductase n=1 Tax=Dictyobacter alpinus TaxID=2014873 RepID=A0A402B1F5_9CHLR|nr:LLM class flavin-dependent oxidoreductase [Dictyobacter alpinus]GCE25168.1 N5,N10-methylene tetrahydromethanopterin reductase [Dictyobacter alpinus]